MGASGVALERLQAALMGINGRVFAECDVFGTGLAVVGWLTVGSWPAAARRSKDFGERRRAWTPSMLHIRKAVKRKKSTGAMAWGMVSVVGNECVLCS